LKYKKSGRRFSFYIAKEFVDGKTAKRPGQRAVDMEGRELERYARRAGASFSLFLNN
jgi:hypothetical protein